MEAPFDCKGNLMHYRENSWNSEGKRIAPEMREVEPFFAVIHLVGMVRGRSATYYEWRSDEGVVYPMFLTDLEFLLQTSSVINGMAVGTFQVKKRGKNYGIRVMHEPQENKKTRATKTIKTTML